MNFGDALNLIKQGYKLQRKGWNGTGMFIYYVPANKYKVCTKAAETIMDGSCLVEYGAYIAMYTADKIVVPWLASQTDILAEDWVAVD